MRIGIVGTGAAARNMAQTIRCMQQQGADVSIHAIASRDPERASQFAARWGAARAYAPFERLLLDPQTDLVFIAIPHSLHAAYIHKCIEYGKAVLCEKTFSMNAQEAEDIFRHAREKNVYVADGLWTRYMPVWAQVKQLLHDGAIGLPCMLKADSCCAAEQVARIRSVALGGGALMDMGIYALNFARIICGNAPVSISSTAEFLSSGPDKDVSVLLQYPDGMMAQLHTSVSDSCKPSAGGIVYGTAGCLLVDSIIRPLRVEILQHGCNSPQRQILIPDTGTGYEYEVAACMRDLTEGHAEPREMSHAETLFLLAQMDQIRSVWQPLC